MIYVKRANNDDNALDIHDYIPDWHCIYAARWD